jgi:hypothetical protein
VEVTGGVGGTTADLAAMALAATALLECARALEEAAARLAAAAVATGPPVTAALDPAGWAAAQRRLAGLLAGAGGLGALAVQTRVLGSAVRAAARAYAEGDAAAGRALVAARSSVAEAAGRGARYVLPVVALAAVPVAGWRTCDLVLVAAAGVLGDVGDGRLTGGELAGRSRAFTGAASARLTGDAADVTDAALAWLARHPAVAEHGVGAVPAFLTGASGLEPRPAGHVRAATSGGRWSLPPEDVRDVAALVALVGYGTGTLGRGRVGVRPAAVPPLPPARPPAGVEDLVRRAVALAPSPTHAPPGEPGRIRVERVRSASGTVAAVVYAPGTQTWGRGRGRNPMDAASNLDAMAGVTSAAQHGVVQALRRARVGRDEPLLLVGYSQGGLTSMALAADPGFRAEFAPAAVLTVGSPVAAFDVPDDVAVLSVEHAEDLVTLADGARNPDRTSWTTVRRELQDPQTGNRVVHAALGERPFAAHASDAYVATAAMVDDCGDPSVRGWLREARPFLDRPGSTASASDWVAERTVPR